MLVPGFRRRSPAALRSIATVNHLLAMLRKRKLLLWSAAQRRYRRGRQRIRRLDLRLYNESRWRRIELDPHYRPRTRGRRSQSGAERMARDLAGRRRPGSYPTLGDEWLVSARGISSLERGQRQSAPRRPERRRHTGREQAALRRRPGRWLRGGYEADWRLHSGQ
jgi:hypothetical protein